MRRRLLAALATAVVVTGCGTTTQQGGHAAPERHDPMAGMAGMAGMSGRSGTSGMELAGMRMRAGRVGGRPSPAATMICTAETGHSIERTFGLRAVPARRPMWMPPVYGCGWALPHGTLDLAVDDATRPGQGRRRFEQLEAATPGARRLTGMAGFGLPAFESRPGMVVFLKDGKVLSVDARRVAGQDLPDGFNRESVAYSVAAGVVACWSK
jgi:hypothetical protein